MWLKVRNDISWEVYVKCRKEYNSKVKEKKMKCNTDEIRNAGNNQKKSGEF